MHSVRTFLLAVGIWAMAISAWAQTEGTYTVRWQAVAAAPAPAVMPSFEEAAFLNREEIPYLLLPISNASVRSFEFTRLEFAPIPEPVLGSFPKNGLKTEISFSITSGTSNGVPHSVVAFQPFRVNPQTGVIEKLLSFGYRYTTNGSAARKAPGQSALHRTYASRSVLSTGDWFKIGVPAHGMYKLDRAALQSLGVNLQGLNPRNLKLYGNGGGMLPQPNSASRPDDLVENAIWVEGEQDGSFDANDYLLFYGQGPHTWSVNTASGQTPFVHSFNLYTDTTYYYLNVGSSAGLRVGQQASLAGSFPIISTYDERWFHEVDLRNMVNSGREWYGEEFTSFAPTQNFTVPASDLVSNSTVWLTSAVMANSPANSQFTVRLNGAVQGTQDIAGRGTFNYHAEGVNHVMHFSPGLSSLAYTNDLTVSYNYQPGGSSSATGYLNYFTLSAQRQLKVYGNQTSFRSLASRQNASSTFQVSGVAGDAQVWNVTDPLRPFRQALSNNNSIASFSAASQQLQEYVAFQGNSFPAPSLHGKISNQNLHSLNLDGKLDLIIITPAAFAGQAQRLASHRSSRGGIQAEVVVLPKIYEEFSSGKPDITALRDFLKMVHSRSSKQGDDLLQVILLGDASFDPKRRLPQNTNFIPIYESRQSLDPITSYSSDDYIGFLDDEEGEWSEVNFSLSHLLDVGIGRLPVKSAAEADLIIDKIIRYESEQSLGNWRKRLIFLADDGDTNEHLNDADYLAEYVERNYPAYLPQKIYLDLYPQVSVPNGQRSPETNKALREAIEKGALVTNYTGHGNALSLADEQIVTIPEILDWKNADRLTFFLTATCEFGRYDDPRRNSGAETALFHPAGGAVALLTTTRPVYSDGNRALNTNFFQFLFKPLANGSMPTLGALTTQTKNASLFGVNNRNFALLGDPSMRLAYPAQEVVVSKLNGKPFSAAASDTLKALSTVRLEGFVSNSQQQIAEGFQGKIHVTVYDKRASLTTLGDQNPKRQILSRNNVLYDGLASVKNGAFEISMVVPKDINYQIGAGSIQLYAFSSSTDAHGATSVPVGGANANATADISPPQLKLFLNDESFVSGGLAGTDATFLAHLFDENGINTAGAGIGHEITVILDEKTAEPIVLNEFYTADVDSYQSGKVRYALKNLTPGPHTLTLKAWDTHNNSSTGKLEFMVASSEKLTLEHVYNIPNPFLNKTTFHFDHNRPGQELDILIQIFTVSGKIVKTLHGISNGSTHFSDITWDGRDDYHDKLAKGVYIYKVNIRSRLDGATSSRFEKLVLLN
jgi:hypothetical protein